MPCSVSSVSSISFHPYDYLRIDIIAETRTRRKDVEKIFDARIREEVLCDQSTWSSPTVQTQHLNGVVASLSHHVLAHIHHHRHHFVRQHASREVHRRLRLQLRLVIVREKDLRARVRYGVADDREVDGDAALLRVENRVDEARERVGREIVVLECR